MKKIIAGSKIKLLKSKIKLFKKIGVIKEVPHGSGKRWVINEKKLKKLKKKGAVGILGSAIFIGTLPLLAILTAAGAAGVVASQYLGKKGEDEQYLTDHPIKNV